MSIPDNDFQRGQLWLLDSGYACGGIVTRGGRIVEACVVFEQWLGKELRELPIDWKVQRAEGRYDHS